MPLLLAVVSLFSCFGRVSLQFFSFCADCSSVEQRRQLQNNSEAITIVIVGKYVISTKRLIAFGVQLSALGDVA